jgi:hypothetical protein
MSNEKLKKNAREFKSEDDIKLLSPEEELEDFKKVYEKVLLEYMRDLLKLK